MPGEATSALAALREHLAADESMRRAWEFRRGQLAEQVVRIRERAQLLEDAAEVPVEP